MKNRFPRIDYTICMSCMVCIQSCPFSSLGSGPVTAQKSKKQYPLLVQPDSCTGCGICVKDCPVEAITLYEKE